MSCLRIRQMTPFGNMHLKITVDPKTERELEVFAQLGKGGDVANSDLEAICRLLSLFLRCGGPLRMAIKQLDGIGSSLTVPTKSGRIASLGDGLAKGLIRYTKAKEMFGLRAMLLGEFDLAALDERIAARRAAWRCGRLPGPGRPRSASRAVSAPDSRAKAAGQPAPATGAEEPPSRQVRQRRQWWKERQRPRGQGCTARGRLHPRGIAIGAAHPRARLPSRAGPATRPRRSPPPF